MNPEQVSQVGDKVWGNYSANRYIDEQGEKVDIKSFHLLHSIGWMNDPNGFVYFSKEEYLVLPILSLDSV